MIDLSQFPDKVQQEPTNQAVTLDMFPDRTEVNKLNRERRLKEDAIRKHRLKQTEKTTNMVNDAFDMADTVRTLIGSRMSGGDPLQREVRRLYDESAQVKTPASGMSLSEIEARIIGAGGR
ncbi:hypothetical protein [Vibrio ouci]|uniref:Uncharacterized protein n=1 Tax=Vibrio ouci TaxID=2499078 RepID=A0A4Y8WER6_9VIBR|nr:hypothetical protein [Vibrio ouci]TFH91146.1 hypothetical protein ELS82_13580 [Vibrio ouci]